MKFLRNIAVVFCLILLASFGYDAVAGVTPPGGSNTGGVAGYRHSSPYSFNFTGDRPTYWIPFGGRTGTLIDNAGATTAYVVSDFGSGTTVKSLEINSSGINAFNVSTNGTGLAFLLPIPGDCDLSQVIDLRVLYSSSQTSGSFVMVVDALALNADTTAVSSATSDRAVAGDAETIPASANVIAWSDWSTWAASTFTARDNLDDLLKISISFTLTTASSIDVYGTQVRCYRKYMGMSQP